MQRRLRRVSFRLAIWIECVLVRYEPVAEIWALFLRHVFGPVLTTLARDIGVEVPAHLAHMNIGAALWTLVAP